MSHEPIKQVLKKLPPNYPVASLYVNGVLAPVVTFTTAHDGVAYFINEEGQVSLFDVNKIDGIEFGVAEELEEPDED
jgi:hypothetical protein